MRSMVVLPQPDGPSREKNSPRGTSNVAPSTATNEPKRLCTLSSEMTGTVAALRTSLLIRSLSAVSPAARLSAIGQRAFRRTLVRLQDGIGRLGARRRLVGLGQQGRHGIDRKAAVAAAVDVVLCLIEIRRDAHQLLVEPARVGGELRAHAFPVGLGAGRTRVVALVDVVAKEAFQSLQILGAGG